MEGATFDNIDNQAAWYMVTKLFGTKRRNFTVLRHHFLQDHIPRSHVHVIYVPATEQISEIMT